METETKTEVSQTGGVTAPVAPVATEAVPVQPAAAETLTEEAPATVPVETVAEVEVKEEKSLLSCASCSAVDTSTSALFGIALLVPLIIKQIKRI